MSPTAVSTAGGALVTIAGAHLAGATKVAFGSTPAASFSVVDDGAVTALAPPRPPGSVSLKVTTAGGTSASVAASKVTYAGLPVVKSLSPKVGLPGGGTAVTITGAGFAGASSVAFDGLPAAALTPVSATKLVAVTPPHAVGTVDVIVTGVAGTSAPSTSARFTYAHVASVVGVQPVAGPAAGGATVGIFGTGFTGATAVKFGTTAAPAFAVVDDATIITTTPAHAPGSLGVSVVTPSGRTPASTVAKYSFVAAPVVSSVARSSGLARGGSTVALVGTGFTGASAVTFGGAAAPAFQVVDAKHLTVTTPVHAAGDVDVQVVATGGTSAATSAARFHYFPMDGRDPGGRTSLFVGQELGAVGGFTDFNQGYADYVGTPAGVTIYTDLRAPLSLRQRVDVGSGVLCGSCYLTNPRFDRSMIAIGLYLVDDLPNVVSGARDANIDSLGAWITAADRPVFLRIGYEFDGSWNRYDRTLYIQAFRRIVDRLHADGVDNFVAVWQSSGYTTNAATLLQWYPGDAYVDWAAYSYFNQSNPSGGMLDIARSHAKPVMIAEATPKRNLALGDTTTHWNAWFQPFFQHIHANQDVIKAVAYINTRWFDQISWDASWGDSRVQIRPEIKAKWIAELQSGIWAPGAFDRAANTYVLTPADLTPP